MPEVHCKPFWIVCHFAVSLSLFPWFDQQSRVDFFENRFALYLYVVFRKINLVETTVVVWICLRWSQ